MKRFISTWVVAMRSRFCIHICAEISKRSHVLWRKDRPPTVQPSLGWWRFMISKRTKDGQTYILMEYLDGETLSGRIAKEFRRTDGHSLFPGGPNLRPVPHSSYVSVSLVLIKRSQRQWMSSIAAASCIVTSSRGIFRC